MDCIGDGNKFIRFLGKLLYAVIFMFFFVLIAIFMSVVMKKGGITIKNIEFFIPFFMMIAVFFIGILYEKFMFK